MAIWEPAASRQALRWETALLLGSLGAQIIFLDGTQYDNDISIGGGRAKAEGPGVNMRTMRHHYASLPSVYLDIL